METASTSDHHAPIDPAVQEVVIDLALAYDVEAIRREGALNDVTEFVSHLCDAPVGLVSVLDGERQHFVAASGLDMEGSAREHSFCRYTLREAGFFQITDAAADPRFSDNPFVTGETHVRFYAGMPLVSAHGTALGSVCVLDTKPRPEGLTPLQREGLAMLAKLMTARLDDRRALIRKRGQRNTVRAALEESELKFRTLADTMPQMLWSTRPDGSADYYNARWYEFTGAAEGSSDNDGWYDLVHAEDTERASLEWQRSIDSGEPYEIEYRLRHVDDGYRWVLGRALAVRDAEGRITRWFGTCTDIDEQKRITDEREIVSQELSHRIKNIFAVIAGLVSFAARSKPEFAEIATDLRQRITALGRAHDFVRPHSLRSQPIASQDSLKGLLGDLFAPYQGADEDRIVVRGDDIRIDDRSATPLALLFHELATNATKYGALSVDDGRVTITIRGGAGAGEDAGNDQLVMEWREDGGPPVSPPDALSGFGTQLVELSAIRQLGGTVERDWAPEGLRMRVTLPGDALSR